MRLSGVRALFGWLDGDDLERYAAADARHATHLSASVKHNHASLVATHRCSGHRLYSHTAVAGPFCNEGHILELFSQIVFCCFHRPTPNGQRSFDKKRVQHGDYIGALHASVDEDILDILRGYYVAIIRFAPRAVRCFRRMSVDPRQPRSHYEVQAESRAIHPDAGCSPSPRGIHSVADNVPSNADARTTEPHAIRALKLMNYVESGLQPRIQACGRVRWI